jgi:VCBS repeat-containing protein
METGADGFTFKVNDGTADSNTATITVTITGTNDAPVANDNTLAVTEEVVKSGTLTATIP